MILRIERSAATLCHVRSERISVSSTCVPETASPNCCMMLYDVLPSECIQGIVLPFYGFFRSVLDITLQWLIQTAKNRRA